MTSRGPNERPIAIVGGAGFIGSNLAASFLEDGRRVTIVDSLARPGVAANQRWLAERFGDRVRLDRVDVRDPEGLRSALSGSAAVFHFAAQVAVTTSLADPVEDFDVNARGTLNVLEAVRAEVRPVPVVFASTNKVYGALADLPMECGSGRWRPVDGELAACGLSETRDLAFCTPYGCSKGTADQYVLDYAASYGLQTASVRMSCVYGPRQFGTEDQGWVAHFLIKAIAGDRITLYGDGRQVRDLLHVSDAVAAYRGLLDRIDTVAGRAFNLGGGPANAVSLGDVIAEIETLVGPVGLDRSDWRTGDQLWFVADTRRIADATGWQPRVSWREGVADLADWIRQSRTGPAARLDQRRIPA